MRRGRTVDCGRVLPTVLRRGSVLSVAADRRRRERHGAAALRAVGASPLAELRAGRVSVADRPYPVAAPYLTIDRAEMAEDRHRGIVDAFGVRLRYSDRALYERTEPDDIVARLVFDYAEQARCESLVPTELDGVNTNIEKAFRAWCAEQNMTDTALGELLYTVLHMIRSRLVHPLQNEAIEDSIESTRAAISPYIGKALRDLRSRTHDQEAFASAAIELAHTVAALVDAGSEGAKTSRQVDSLGALIVPHEWGRHDDVDDRAQTVEGVERGAGEILSGTGSVGAAGYEIFTGAYDVETAAASLYPDAVGRQLRQELDDQVRAQSVSVFTLARRLQRFLLGLEPDGFSVGEDTGQLDSHRLARIVASPDNQDVFKRPRYRITSPAVVSFLIDNSGSMKRQRHESVTVLVDTLVRALDLAGASSEVLGFTTASWNGGACLRDWRRAGEPASPGRLAEVCHIVYKSADSTWRRSRVALAAMMKTQHFREGVDGEAVAWAHGRLIDRPEPRKLLVVISDGAPMESATLNANGASYLDHHLRDVVASIERRSPVRLGAISVDRAVDSVFADAVEMDLSGTLRMSDYLVLEELFG